MTLYNSTKKHFEGVLSDLTGTEVEIQVRLKNFDQSAFKADCWEIRHRVSVGCLEITLTVPDKDSYYLALKICLDRYPFVPDQMFADAFGVKRCTIVQNKKKIEEIMRTDDNFKQALKQLQ